MNIDLSPLYRSSIGFDRLAGMLNSVYNSDASGASYPPYNIEILDEKRYAITLAVAGFENTELDIQVEKSVLTVSGHRAKEDTTEYLHRGIATWTFERKFNLADYVTVVGAELSNGLLTINLVREMPKATKPKTIFVNSSGDTPDVNSESDGANDKTAANNSSEAA